MSPDQSNACSHCGSEMTSVFQNKRTRYVCEKCDADPMHSPKVEKLLNAVRPPKEA